MNLVAVYHVALFGVLLAESFVFVCRHHHYRKWQAFPQPVQLPIAEPSSPRRHPAQGFLDLKNVADLQ
jgi:hypothetical protein